MVTTFVKRPKSPVNFETVAVSPEDILCYGSDEEATPEEHRDKRRRVESLANQYLEGRGLFILSAGLRGPLNPGWVNPWAIKKTTSKADETKRTLGAEKRIIEDSALPKHREPRSSIANDSHPLLQTGNAHNPTVSHDHQNWASHSVQAIGSVIPHNQGDYKNWSPEEIAQVKDRLQKYPRGWLKSNNAPISKHLRHKSRSPTPTPTCRDRELDRTTSTPPILTKSPSVTFISQSFPQEQKYLPQRMAGFIPINKRAAISKDDGLTIERKPNQLNWLDDRVELEQNLLPKRSACEADHCKVNKPTQKSHNVTKHRTPNPPNLAFKPEQHSEEPESNQEDALLTSKNSANTDTRHLKNDALEDSTAPYSIQNKPIEDNPSKYHKSSLQALPPSTYLSEFEYRYATKPPPPPPPPTGRERLPFAKALEVAKREAEKNALKRISFITSGTSKRFDSRRSSPTKSESTLKSLSSLSGRRKSSQNAASSKVDRTESSHNLPDYVPYMNAPSEPDVQPEAQIVLAEPAALTPSGPSMNLLETDKLSRLEESDSFAQLSTQAAILKAQQSFRNELLSSTDMPREQSPCPDFVKTSESENKHQPTSTPQTARNGRPDDRANGSTPNGSNQELMSTQAMVNAMSPFAVSTLKKPKRASFVQSQVPYQNSTSPNSKHPKSSLSLSTDSLSPPSPLRSKIVPPVIPLSHTQSKPSSSAVSLPSFSIAPNGTLTEIYQHDGQQPQQFFESESWNLDDAIEEAGNFLGTWDIEAETKKTALTNKTIDSSGNNNQKGKWEITPSG